ncbi:MAG TPA: helix-hairpin-helix domain-containing protein [bacterium]|nr:helix-hairpin-helix domain-containing protein [bacterium]
MKDLIIKKLSELLDLKILAGEDKFKIRAYENAIFSLEKIETDILKSYKSGELKNFKGIGKGIYSVIEEIIISGESKQIIELKKKFPETLFDLFKISGLGPRRIKSLYDELSVKSIEDLKKAHNENLLSKIKGFGEKFQKNLIENILKVESYSGKYLFITAWKQSEDLRISLEKTGFFKKIEIVGSVRRRIEIAEKIEMLAVSDRIKEIADYIIKIESVKEIISSNDSLIRFRFLSGIICEIKFLDEIEFYGGLIFFTGSNKHIAALNGALEKSGIKISNSVIFKNNLKISSSSERELYEDVFGMQYIEPELRENGNAINLAIENKIPVLISENDIKGIFHIHTSASDGTLTIEQIYGILKQSGYIYAGISDHSKSAFYARGLSDDFLLRQRDFINEFNKEHRDFYFYSGIESDILSDGSLDYDDSVLKKLDFVIASVHSGFKMTKSEMTRRICSALKNNYCAALGHPTGRLLLSREGYEIDIKEIIKTASGENKMIELNCNPYRMDIDWRNLEYAKKMNVKIMLSPDAHHKENFEYIRLGVFAARKGMLEKIDVINTYGEPLPKKMF